jgi:tetraacyldisaccharide 4'-kinase
MRILPGGEAPIPVVAVGNLTVGGSGKTPMAAWVARHYAAQGYQPAIVMRGYGGGDEGRVHRRLVEEAIVIENADRLEGSREAAAGGAHVVILDDAYQRLDIQRDLNVVLVSTESSRAVPWTFPAGPWREGLGALRRADFLIVTRKRADRASAERLAARLEPRTRHCPIAIARLGVTGFRELLSGMTVSTDALDGARILAAAGIADPQSFAGQCREFGADVRTLRLADHHGFTEQDVRAMLHAGRRVDYVVVTEKDAVKLQGLWPESAPEPLVASLDVDWDMGQDEFETVLDSVVSQVEDLI